MFIYIETKEKENTNNRSFDYIEIGEEFYNLSSCFGAGVDIEGEAKGHFYFVCEYKNISFKVYTELKIEKGQATDKYFILDETYSKLRNKYYN